jgi:ParB-like chromosome segregation protein Spo0J
MSDPIDSVRWVPATDLHANDWNPNRVFTPELRLLEHNLLTLGWVQPILANRHGLVIDGFHRWRLSQDSEAVKRRWGGLVPVAYLDLEDGEAMALTVRMNRAKGQHVAVHMHALVARLLTDHGWPPERVAKEIGAAVMQLEDLAAARIHLGVRIGVEA